ncbi:MAG: ABC transporter permease subunit [Nitriliruptorales bacterium]|nr:ABC transporter permease subunit [Nitriliruptorales bacterium]
MSLREGAQPGGTTRWALSANAWLVFGFFYLPIVLLVALSFNDNRMVGVWGGASLRWYREMLGNASVIASLQNSLVVAGISTVLSTVLGTATAIALERFRFRGRAAFDGLVYLPVIIPDVTMAVMMLLFFARAFAMVYEATGTTLHLGITTITLSHIAFNISFVAIVVRARLAGLDPALEEAAADLYADRRKTFRHVTLPLIMPGILGGALLALTLSLDDVVITSFVAGPGSTTLPVYVFGLVRRGVTPLINAVSTVMLAASMLLVLFSLLVQRRSQ